MTRQPLSPQVFSPSHQFQVDWADAARDATEMIPFVASSRAANEEMVCWHLAAGARLCPEPPVTVLVDVGNPEPAVGRFIDLRPEPGLGSIAAHDRPGERIAVFPPSLVVTRAPSTAVNSRLGTFGERACNLREHLELPIPGVERAAVNAARPPYFTRLGEEKDGAL